jgi:hypothetical protein
MSSPGVASQMPGMIGLMANAGLWGAFPPSKGKSDHDPLDSSQSGSSDESDFETLTGVRNTSKGKGPTTTKSAKTAMPPASAGSVSSSLSLDDMMKMHFERQLASGQSLDVGAMLQYQMMQELTSKSRGRSAHAGSDSEEEGELDMDHDRTSKGFRGVSAMRKKFRNDPASICKDYRKLAKRVLGISDSKQAWSYKDLSKKFLKTFGRMKGLWRAYAGLQQIIQLHEDGHAQHAHAYACQLSKTLHQVAIDQGGWDSAIHYLPEQDALGEPAWAGEESELAAIQSYRKSLRELSVKGSTVVKEEEEPEVPGVVPAPKLSAAQKKKLAEEKKKKQKEAAANP